MASRPLLTQAVTTAVLFAAGDVTAQQAVEKKGFKAHDWSHTGRMFAYGGGEFLTPYLLYLPYLPTCPAHVWCGCSAV